MVINGCRWSVRMRTYVSPVRILSRCTMDPISLQLHTPYTITESLPAWTVPCWHAGSMDSWSCLHARTCPSARYDWKWDSSDQATCFQPSTVQCRCWLAQARRKALCRAVIKGTRVGFRLWKPTSMMFRWMDRSRTLVDDPVLKSWAICGRAALLSCWTILFNRHWSRSCRIFFRPLRCRRFDVLPDSWCTCTGKSQTHNYLGDAVRRFSCADYKTSFKLIYIVITWHSSSSNRSTPVPDTLGLGR